jgi:hypothetical protein
MKNLYYNVQLISSFLLDKTRFLLILLLILLNGNNIFSLVFCEENIENVSLNQDSNEKQSNNTYLYLGFVVALAVGILVAYLYLNGGDTGDTAASLTKNINHKQEPILEGFEAKPEAYIRVCENLAATQKGMNIELREENIKLSLKHQVAATQAEVNLKLAKGVANEYKKLEVHDTILDNRQTDLYRFLMEMFVKHPETQKDITRFTQTYPPIEPFKHK